MKRVKKYLAGMLLGSSLALGNCDPLVKETLLTGAESTASALTDAVLGSVFDQLASRTASATN